MVKDKSMSNSFLLGEIPSPPLCKMKSFPVCPVPPKEPVQDGASTSKQYVYVKQSTALTYHTQHHELEMNCFSYRETPSPTALHQ